MKRSAVPLSAVLMALTAPPSQAQPALSAARALAGVVVVQPAGTPPPRISDVTPMLVGLSPQRLATSVPLVHTAVEVDIRGLVAATTVTQVYENQQAQPLEATYVFPLPPGSAVYEMEARVGDRIIRSVVQEKNKARKTYQAARNSGRRAALLEQQRPNVFTTRLANLMPGDRVDITLRYVELLSWEGGRIRLTFPTVVAPRFIPADLVPGALGCMAPSGQALLQPTVAAEDIRAGHDISFELSAHFASDLPLVHSPTHAMAIQATTSAGVHVELADGGIRPDRDVVVDFELPQQRQAATALYVSPFDDGQGAHFMWVAFPPAEQPANRRPPMDWLFVVDVSGSMAGTSMEQARGALLESLGRMREGDRFNMVAYNHTYWSFSPEPVEVGPEATAKARAFVAGLDAGGGTMLLPALQQAMRQPRQDGNLRYIVVMTDGELGNEEQVLDGLRQDLGDARLFMVAVGSAPNHFLAQKMAEYGRGAFTSISSPDEIRQQMGALLNRIESPVLSDIALVFQGAQVADLYPVRVPDLFLGSPVVVYGRLMGTGGTVTVTGVRNQDAFKQVLPFDVMQAHSHAGIRTLWARAVVEDMMDRWRHSSTEAEREVEQQRIVEFATQQHLVTQFTSLVAVEERVVNPGGVQDHQDVPVELPNGMVRSQVLGGNPQGGTADAFLAWLSLVMLALGGGLWFTTGQRRRTWARAA